MYFENYEHLIFDRVADGVLQITINRPAQYNAMTERMHEELGRVWLDVHSDQETRCAVITGAGKAFCAGGDFEMVEKQLGNVIKVAKVLQEATDIVYNMIDCQKPIISAINGAAVGGGLAVALMADISIIAEDASIRDGHVPLGLAAGDHAAIIWPLLCGLAKARYYLLTGETISGSEAERIGLVSRCLPRAEVLPKALEIASGLARGPELTQRWTKRTLNHWVRAAGPIFDASLAYEIIGFFGADVREGLNAVRDRRTPDFRRLAAELGSIDDPAAESAVSTPETR